jgi:hypothetical protein
VGLSDAKRLTLYDGLPEMKLRGLFAAYEDLVQQHAIVAEEAVLGKKPCVCMCVLLSSNACERKI